MKLASRVGDTRDGSLLLVSRDLSRAAAVEEIAPTMQHAIEHWSTVAPQLDKAYQELNAGHLDEAFDLDMAELVSPFPRAVQFLDGSAYLAHVERVRKARGAEMPPSFLEDPLMYQAVCDRFLGPFEDIPVESEEFGIDFESEVVCVVDDVAMAASPEMCADHIKLIGLVNDVSLRGLIPAELGKGFGFLHGKPRSALSPVMVTLDELGDAWSDGKVNLPLITHYNGELFGEPEAGEDMQFSLPELVAHAARTRPLAAGTIVGTGTIANHDLSRGSSCLAEKRVLEVIADGEARTPFMRFGDTVRIEMKDREGGDIFGPIEQKIVQYEKPAG